MASNGLGVEHLLAVVDGLGAVAEAVAPPIAKDGFQVTDLLEAGTALATDAELRQRAITGVQALISFGELKLEAEDLSAEEYAQLGAALFAAGKKVYNKVKAAQGA